MDGRRNPTPTVNTSGQLPEVELTTSTRLNNIQRCEWTGRESSVKTDFDDS